MDDLDEIITDAAVGADETDLESEEAADETGAAVGADETNLESEDTNAKSVLEKPILNAEKIHAALSLFAGAFQPRKNRSFKLEKRSIGF